MWGGNPYAIVLWIFGPTMKWSPIGPRKTFLAAFLGLASHAPWIALGVIGQHVNLVTTWDGEECWMKVFFWWNFCRALVWQECFFLVIGVAPM